MVNFIIRQTLQILPAEEDEIEQSNWDVPVKTEYKYVGVTYIVTMTLCSGCKVSIDCIHINEINKCRNHDAEITQQNQYSL